MNSPKRPHILILPRWYPHRYDPMPGLFIRYQAEALALHCDVSVLYVHPDPDCPNEMETEFGMENRVQVVRVYYRPGKNPVQQWSRFYHAHFAGLRVLDGTPPDLVHVHILTREGFMGWRISRRYGVPMIISEHWSRYFPENDFFRSPAKRMITRFVLSKAKAVLPVSIKLKEAMVAKGLDHPVYRVVPNVLDMQVFHAGSGSAGDKKRIVHVSCFDDRSKNISGLLDAVAELRKKRTDFVLHLVGEGPDLARMKEYSAGLGLTQSEVVFQGLMTGEELAGEYGTADFSILSSRFETFGTVIAESLACGTPVLATATGIAPEIISDENGMLIKPGDVASLVSGIDAMLGKCRMYDRNRVRASVEGKFSPERISAMLIGIYNMATEKKDV